MAVKGSRAGRPWATDMLETGPVQGQVDRFEAAYRSHGARLSRSVLLYAGDTDVASDAVAEAFAQTIRRGDEVRDLVAWVTRAAFRIAAGSARRGGAPRTRS